MSDMENAMDIENDQIINSAEADAAVDSTYVCFINDQSIVYNEK